MTVKEMFEVIENEIEELLEEGYVVGVRFEDMEREEGEIVTERSRHNYDREDERDFPEYGTDEYFEMMEFDGVSTWNAELVEEALGDLADDDEKANRAFMADHGYIMYSFEDANKDEALDFGEVVLVDPKVAKVLF